MNHVQQHFDEHAAVYLGDEAQLRKIWAARQPLFARCLQGRSTIRFLDVGGGAGYLADRILETFPTAQVTIVDLSQALLNYNRPHPQKTCVCQDAFAFFQACQGQQQFDVINFDVLLHHILTPRSFAESRRLQQRMLEEACRLLAPGGFISIREIAYHSLPGLPHQATHRWLWFASTRALPAFLRHTLQRLGLKSQGGGVCFLSREMLVQMLQRAGLTTDEIVTQQFARFHWKYAAALAGQVVDTYIMAQRPFGGSPAVEANP